MAEPEYGRLLREAREKAGKSVDEMASLLGISRAWYFDLESYDEEITDTLSLRQLLVLSKALGIDLADFFPTAA